MSLAVKQAEADIAPSPPPHGLETHSGKDKDKENFPVASLLIRQDLRSAVHCFYDFARAADDVADNPALSADEKIKRLQRFAAVLDGAEDKACPAALNLSLDLRQRGLPAKHAKDLLIAFTQDAEKQRYAHWDELLEYCLYSAAPVGRMVLDLHQVPAAAWPASDALCSALQIINHLQDCAEDYTEMGRVYIPADMLASRGAAIEDLAAAAASAGLRATLDDMLLRLQPLMEQARRLPPQIKDMRLRLEVSIIYELAAALVLLLKKEDPLQVRCKLSKFSKLLAVLRGLARGLTAQMSARIST